MTSCPTEEDLVLFVEDALDAGPAEDVAEHLVDCAECRRLVARSEAALRYALGGTADRERAPRGTAVRRPVRRWSLAAAAVAAAAVLAAYFVTRPQETVTAGRGSSAVPAAPPSLSQRLDALLADAGRIEGLRREDDGRSDVALAALVAAETRVGLGLPTAAARFQDVADRFPGTPEAREARARVAELGGSR